MWKLYPRAILALGMMAAATPALAGPIVSNRYYEDSAVIGCSSNCRLNFSAVPAGGALLITHVTCQITPSPGELVSATLTIATSGGKVIETRREMLVTSLSVTQGTAKVYVATGETLFLYKPGQFPVVVASPTSDGTIFVSCRIAGERPSPL